MSTNDHRYALPKEGPASCTGCAWKSRPIGISSLTQHEEHRKAVAAAADQPTTEPSVLDEALAAVREYFRITSVAPTEGGVMVPVAHLRALYDALAPAPQPAADTETEVQWGVRGTDLSTRTIVIEARNEDEARGRAKESARKGGDFVAVRRTVTPWGEA